MSDFEGLNFDTDDAYIEPPIDEGRYGAEIRTVEAVVAETGRPGMRVGFRITDSGEYEGRFLSDSLWFPIDEDRGQPFGKKSCDKYEGMLGMTAEKVKKVGLWPENGAFDPSAFAEEAIGLALNVKVKHQLKDRDGNDLDEPRVEVDRWYRI